MNHLYICICFFFSSIEFGSCEWKINRLLNKARERPNYTDYLNCGRQCQYGSPITNDYMANKLTIPKRDRLTRIKLAKIHIIIKTKTVWSITALIIFNYVLSKAERTVWRFVSYRIRLVPIQTRKGKKEHNTTREAFRFNHWLRQQQHLLRNLNAFWVSCRCRRSKRQKQQHQKK